ncbi:MAG: hypothetical protein A2X77_03650 [Gammaproteobacteria bacterium GWE2_42_36]|nr:MAG: hypothetical protein A2X77_03650 [Gammaproteobacteria bacterium GWE2_42_36]HCU05674.1 hypothetical protein [Coxiellaceae bacterium]
MPRKTTDLQQLQKELKKSKEIISAQTKEISSLKKSFEEDLEILLEEAYMAGYTDALEEADKKAMSMEKFLQQALDEFEKVYQRTPDKKAKKSSTSKKAKSKSKK